ncbi:heavy-metal-associated domain-containing protein [Halarchaeum sp. P4]|uniref:heavy-metal-associated domain-containing protein n=1 Tax=Halarchaeum sp. P4 TaxID=3421639 RepID=UPI003EB961DD
MSKTLDIDGMTCAGCTRVVTSVLEDVEGVENADVDLDTETATVEGDTDTDALVSAVEAAGYSANA